MPKRGIGIDVLTAARQRIAWTFNNFPKIYVSFSGGKDSTCMLHLAMDEARRRNRRVGLLFVDLEAQYKLTINHVRECYDQYSEWIDPFWVALPLHLRNAVSQYQSHWVCWDRDARELWVREPDAISITDTAHFPFFRHAMEFEEFVVDFGHWYSGDELCACLVGIRSDESLNRYRTVAGHGTKMEGRGYTNWCGKTLWNIYPIYDWRTEDDWTYLAKSGMCYNRLYDRMHMAGLTIHQMRICQPYGDDQRKGLWLFHLIEPETWGRVVQRVNGANAGALYVQERGNVLGQYVITKPDCHTWQSFSKLLLDSMPAKTSEHFSNKIAVFLKWYRDRGYPNGIPDDGPLEKTVPSWKRICKSLLRNDYWCKGLSFSQHKSAAYERYRQIMKNRRAQWGI